MSVPRTNFVFDKLYLLNGKHILIALSFILLAAMRVDMWIGNTSLFDWITQHLPFGALVSALPDALFFSGGILLLAPARLVFRLYITLYIPYLLLLLGVMLYLFSGVGRVVPSFTLFTTLAVALFTPLLIWIPAALNNEYQETLRAKEEDLVAARLEVERLNKRVAELQAPTHEQQ